VRSFVPALLLLALFAGHARADALRDVERTTSGGDDDDDDSYDYADDDEDEGWSASSRDDRAEQCGGPGQGCSFAAGFGELAAYGAAYLFSAPWWVPRLADEPCLQTYADYPFADRKGLLRSAPACADAPGEDSYRIALDSEVESGFLLEGVVPATLAVRLHLPHRFELSGRLSLLGDVLEQKTELATSALAHVMYRHAQSKRVEFRTGVGVRMFALEAFRAGLDLLYAVDAYIARRGVFRTELHLGTLGQAFAGQVRATAGVSIGRCELYAGYDHTVFVGRGKATLGGPIAGLRAWF
jgi:hypothetical protein